MPKAKAASESSVATKKAEWHAAISTVTAAEAATRTAATAAETARATAARIDARSAGAGTATTTATTAGAGGAGATAEVRGAATQDNTNLTWNSLGIFLEIASPSRSWRAVWSRWGQSPKIHLVLMLMLWEEEELGLVWETAAVEDRRHVSDGGAAFFLFRKTITYCEYTRSFFMTGTCQVLVRYCCTWRTCYCCFFGWSCAPEFFSQPQHFSARRNIRELRWFYTN